MDLFIDRNDSFSNYLYFNNLKSVPAKYTFDLANIREPFSVDAQKRWFKDYLKTPTGPAIYIIKQFLNKLSMNSRLRNQLEGEFLEDIQLAVGVASSTLVDNKDYNQLSNEQFQDLIFVTCAETIYNPEIEYELSGSFLESNKVFWNRFTELYKKCFTDLNKDSFIQDSFFLNEEIKKQKERLGFELLEEALLNYKYPKYYQKFSYYLNMPNNTERARQEDFKEYKEFRKREFALYKELCEQYKINSIRTTEI